MEWVIVLVIVTFAAGAVLWPLVKKPARNATFSEQELDERVAAYRAAIKGRTLCDRCLTANPTGSRFCYNCGQATPDHI
jgi:hypothetical protein